MQTSWRTTDANFSHIYRNVRTRMHYLYEKCWDIKFESVKVPQDSFSRWNLILFIGHCVVPGKNPLCTTEQPGKQAPKESWREWGAKRMCGRVWRRNVSNIQREVLHVVRGNEVQCNGNYSIAHICLCNSKNNNNNRNCLTSTVAWASRLLGLLQLPQLKCCQNIIRLAARGKS